MTAIFVDTFYWVAVARPNDAWKKSAVQARVAVGNVELVTTDEVLVEFLASLAKGSAAVRLTAAQMVRAILVDPQVRVVPQSHEGFLEALSMFENRSDKQYSLTDCISMNVMKSEGIGSVLTNDGHFAQEGFQVLIQK